MHVYARFWDSSPARAGSSKWHSARPARRMQHAENSRVDVYELTCSFLIIALACLSARVHLLRCPSNVAARSCWLAGWLAGRQAGCVVIVIVMAKVIVVVIVICVMPVIVIPHVIVNATDVAMVMVIVMASES